MSCKGLIYLSPLFSIEEKEKPKVYCKRCGRLLKGETSVELGYGPQCYRIQKLEKNQQITLFNINTGDANAENGE